MGRKALTLMKQSGSLLHLFFTVNSAIEVRSEISFLNKSILQNNIGKLQMQENNKTQCFEEDSQMLASTTKETMSFFFT